MRNGLPTIELNMSILTEIQDWYASNCDSQWEEECGIRIDTLDNPGWSVTIDLFETNLDEREFSLIRRHELDGSWIECRVEEKQFRGSGDPSKLEVILSIFLDWAKSQNEDWLTPPPPMTPEEYQRHSDESLFTSLGNEVQGEKCRTEGCNEDRIKYSVMCRAHHFEMVTGRQTPSSTVNNL